MKVLFKSNSKEIKRQTFVNLANSFQDKLKEALETYQEIGMEFVLDKDLVEELVADYKNDLELSIIFQGVLIYLITHKTSSIKINFI